MFSFSFCMENIISLCFHFTGSCNTWESLDITQGMVVKEYQNWGDVYTIQFDIKVTNVPSILVNVFQFIVNDDVGTYGPISALWITEDEHFYICSAINGDKDFCESFCFALGMDHQITMQQFKDNGKYWYQILIDGKTKLMIENTQPESFPIVNFYASDQWNETFSSEFGSIGNVKIGK